MTALGALLVLAAVQPASTQPPPTDSAVVARQVRAIRVATTIAVDGLLNDPGWAGAERISGLLQRDPTEGAAASESTVVFVAYDDGALYIGARLFDAHPDSIVARLGRRDVYTSSDLFTVYLDPYHDRRSGFFFSVNAAGTLYDGTLFNDDWDDDSWDGVWQGKAAIDALGWVVEMRIPYSQIRFHGGDIQVWGINFRREIARKNEIDFHSPRPKNASGFVSRFGDLVGIERITPPRRLEVLSYVNAQAAYTDHEGGDPFNDGSTYTPAVGADVRTALGSNLTLNATVNPDFGQVEVDPAVVNLSDVETFFPEKRPFFIEGLAIFDFGFGGASDYWGFNWPGPDMLHTRRMGRAPQGSTPGATYEDRPDGVSILGAVKLTGKVGGRWNLGTLATVTAREYAQLYDTTTDLGSRKEIEPLTYYGVFRAQREFPEGRQGLGTMVTATMRDFDDPTLRDEINRSAVTGGLDGWKFLDRDKEWVLTGWLAGSHVRGSESRITSLQRNSVRYYQRPDAEQTRVDPNATSLSGWAARFHLNKQKGSWFSNSGLGFISPGYETNDLGFMSRAGVINMHAGAGYAWRQPGKTFRQSRVMGAVFQSYNWDGDVTWRGAWQNNWVQFLNYWSAGFNVAYNPPTLSDRRTRGGPVMRNEPGLQVNFFVDSDSRKTVAFELYGGRYHQGAKDYDAWAGFDLEYRPAPNLSLSVGPSFGWTEEPGQYVSVYGDTTANATFDGRYVFAHLSSTEVGANIRLNWTFTPTLSLQLFAQPLISAGAYTELKSLAEPRTFDFDVYGTGASTIEDSTSYYVVDADGPGGPAPSVPIGKPDFSFGSLRGNAVLRWEYLPGSTVYLVWTQSRDDFEPNGEFRFDQSWDRLRGAPADNIFMLKVTYWWNPR
ncbi:MAG: DUF5916 domain-containing protein [Gemmatimonadales bacterium]